MSRMPSREIQRNRYDVDVPRKLAAQARYEARHATYLAQLIERVMQEEKSDQAGVEALILSWEEPLKRIAADMELAARFDQGMQPPMQEMSEHARQQAQELRRLKQEVADRDEQMAALNTQLQRTEARLGGVSEERVALQRRVDVQERIRANVATIEGSFTPDEARVFRQGDDVVVSLLGVRFPSGRSTIDGGSAALMQKVKAALALFPRRVDIDRRTHGRERRRFGEPDSFPGSRRCSEEVSRDELRAGPGEGQLGRLR